MIDFLFVALLQAAAGDPATATTTPPTEQTTPTDQNAETTGEEARPTRRRCRSREMTGTRLSGVMVCRRGQEDVQDQDTRETLHDLQRPAPTRVN